jgi:two-component system response regulator HupR/HoxA
VDAFLRKVSKDQKTATRDIPKEVLNALTDYDWPGNVRELENEITRLVTLADQKVTLDNLSAKVRGGAARQAALVPEGLEGKKLKQTMEAIEKELLVKALELNRWNKTQTAKELGLSRVALHKKLGKYGIK